MKTGIAFALVFAALVLGYWAGERDGFRQGAAWMETKQAALVADEVAFQIKDFQRVQKIREQAEYHRGRESCKN